MHLVTIHEHAGGQYVSLADYQALVKQQQIDRNNALHTVAQLAKMSAERDALAAQVAELVAQIAGRDGLLNNLSKWINQLPVPTKSATSWLIRIDGLMKQTPVQHLRDIQAEAVEDFIVALFNNWSIGDDKYDIQYYGKNYIAQLPEEKVHAAHVKAGE